MKVKVNRSSAKHLEICIGTTHEKRGLLDIRIPNEKLIFWRRISSKLKDLDKKKQCLAKRKPKQQKPVKNTVKYAKKGGRNIYLWQHPPVQ